MPTREGADNDLPYRTPMTAIVSTTPVSSKNEDNYDTLKIVQKLFRDSLDGLYRDFNAFDVLNGKPPSAAAENLLRQIQAKQIAYDLLSPVLEAVDSAIQTVDDKYKQR